MGGGTPRAIARIEVRAIGSAMWLVRCGCRRGPLRIPAPALVESRPSRSWEPVSGGSCHLRSGVLARPNRARGTNVAVGRVARLPYGVTTRYGRLQLYKYVYKTHTAAQLEWRGIATVFMTSHDDLVVADHAARGQLGRTTILDPARASAGRLTGSS